MSDSKRLRKNKKLVRMLAENIKADRITVMVREKLTGKRVDLEEREKVVETYEGKDIWEVTIFDPSGGVVKYEYKTDVLVEDLLELVDAYDEDEHKIALTFFRDKWEDPVFIEFFS